MKRNTLPIRATRRRFALLVLLHECPRRSREIIASLEQHNLFSYEHGKDASSIEKQRLYQFRRDLRTLRQLDFRIEYDRASRCYCWRNPPFGLSLNALQLTTLALLINTFSDTAILHAADIQALLAFFVSRLPSEQQKLLEDQKRIFSIDLGAMTDYQQTDPLTLSRIEFAIRHGQQLEFLYRSAEAKAEIRHIIEPRPLVFKNGHVYLYGWSVEYEKELQFRLDSVLPGSAQPLHRSVASSRPPQVEYVLRYRLSATLARSGKSQHFPDQQIIEHHSDGSVTVMARLPASSLFDARRILLGYGEHCVVLDPPELVAQMRTVRDHFNTTYPTPDE